MTETVWLSFLLRHRVVYIQFLFAFISSGPTVP